MTNVKQTNYSENVNGIVTVVLPFVTFPKVHVLTAILMISSKLLENVARRILKAIQKEFPDVSYAWVKVKKMNPPLGGKMESVSVELES